MVIEYLGNIDKAVLELFVRPDWKDKIIIAVTDLENEETGIIDLRISQARSLAEDILELCDWVEEYNDINI